MKKLNKKQFYKEARAILAQPEEPRCFTAGGKMTLVEQAIDVAVEAICCRGQDETELTLEVAWGAYQRLYKEWKEQK